MLASEGMAALALAYFGMPGLPKTVRAHPARVLRDRDRVAAAPQRRRGATRWPWPEPRAAANCALLLASTYPEIRAAISWVGSGLVYGGVVSMGAAPVAGWTRGGVDVPFAGFDMSAVDLAASPVTLTPGFLAALADTRAWRRPRFRSSASTVR